jgi:hypothetical protein
VTYVQPVDPPAAPPTCPVNSTNVRSGIRGSESKVAPLRAIKSQPAAVKDADQLTQRGRMLSRVSNVDFIKSIIVLTLLKISEGKEILSVLFVGNSFTYAGNLDQVRYLLANCIIWHESC